MGESRAAVGCSDHSGWAVLVSVVGQPANPVVVDRCRVTLHDDRRPRQPYHAVADRPLDEAGPVIAEVESAALAGARAAIEALVAELAETGHRVAAVGVAAGTTALPDSLPAILGSHPRLHAAEGELYREAVADAAADLGLAVARFPTKRASDEAATAVGLTADAWSERLKQIGRHLGPPWQNDHRDATSAAVLALLAQSAD